MGLRVATEITEDLGHVMRAEPVPARFREARLRPEGAAQDQTLLAAAAALRTRTKAPFDIRTGQNFLELYGDAFRHLREGVIVPVARACTEERLETEASALDFLKYRSRKLGSAINAARPEETVLSDFLVGPLRADLPGQLAQQCQPVPGRHIGGDVFVHAFEDHREIVMNGVKALEAAARDAPDDVSRVVLGYFAAELRKASALSFREMMGDQRTWRRTRVWADIGDGWRRVLGDVLKSVRSKKAAGGKSVNRVRVDAFQAEEQDLVDSFTDNVVKSVQRSADNLVAKFRKSLKKAVNDVVVNLKAAAAGITPKGMQKFAESVHRRPADFDERVAAARAELAAILGDGSDADLVCRPKKRSRGA